MNKILWFAFFCCSIGGILGCSSEKEIRTEVSSGWQFRQKDSGDWLPATVPGTVHTDLLANGRIEDPFYRMNELGLQWIDKKDWEYRTEFSVDDELIGKKNQYLVFQGLDTYADVYLNGECIGSVDNMFRTWKFDVSGKLKVGDNELRVVLASPTARGLEEMKRYGLRLSADNDQSERGGMGQDRVSVYTRKAPYHYGWDWGPRLVTSGIWRPVIIEAWSGMKVEDVYIKQTEVTRELATLSADIRVKADVGQEVEIEITSDGKVLASGKKSLERGENNVSVPFEVESPRLWWSNGLGEQNLYSFKVRVTGVEGVIAEKEVTTGLRSLKLVRKKDQGGESFGFELNGVPVFAKGANIIPNDVFLPRANREVYEKMVFDAANANMNMLRVWGGGIYEDDVFFELCDKYGIMVWHDFMFACAMYPGNKEFLDNVREEAIDNVVRMRNHPCIALWCGNNENALAWRHGSPGGWGWKQQFTKEQQDTVFKAYYDVFHDLLPRVVSEYMPGCDYWPSSPMAGPEPTQHGLDGTTSGDQHYWGVWHGFRPLESYDEVTTRFCSEYGFQSFPEMSTIRTYALPEDYDINSEVMKSHQRSYIGNGRISDYMKMYYRVPTDFEQFIYMTHVLQGLSTKMAIEAHRRNMPYCMGSLVWQLNDCWPVASWSTTDYYHKWKAAHYVMRDCFKEIIVAPKWRNDSMLVYVVSDRLQPVEAELSIDVMDFSGKIIYSEKSNVEIPANTSTVLTGMKRSFLLRGASGKDVFAVVRLTAGGKNVDEKNVYFEYHKDLNLPQEPELSILAREEGKQKYILVTANKLACNVMFALPDSTAFFSDNYIDILPGRTYKINVKTDVPLAEIERRIQYRYLR
ncbi:glycoside hydrolase family 2 protein [Butyricimonas sp. Marseille-P3923]|uniref:beta-mannosidase n=1 Tax=Butyricimonas sp. Marseille-P3923 TaxID=1987504 RepID=UPI000C06B0CC|nr:glycoside hydrolase family 2 protein [Butyricimonas sp. Marseille-P3923]